jgi:hypothetical protein
MMVDSLCPSLRVLENVRCVTACHVLTLPLPLGRLDADAKLQNATISFVISVCPSAWNSSAPTRRILMKFDI